MYEAGIRHRPGRGSSNRSTIRNARSHNRRMSRPQKSAAGWPSCRSPIAEVASMRTPLKSWPRRMFVATDESAVIPTPLMKTPFFEFADISNNSLRRQLKVVSR